MQRENSYAKRPPNYDIRHIGKQYCWEPSLHGIGQGNFTYCFETQIFSRVITLNRGEIEESISSYIISDIVILYRVECHSSTIVMLVTSLSKMNLKIAMHPKCDASSKGLRPVWFSAKTISLFISSLDNEQYTLPLTRLHIPHLHPQWMQTQLGSVNSCFHEMSSL